MKLRIKKLNKNAKLPRYANSGDAGLDFFAIKKYVIKPRDIKLIDTGIAVELPPKAVGLIWDKGSVAMKNGLKTLGGVCDEGYRGEITIGLVNLSKKTYTIEKGDKVAQMLIQRVERTIPVSIKELSSSTRGKKRFGSSGKK